MTYLDSFSANNEEVCKPLSYANLYIEDGEAWIEIYLDSWLMSREKLFTCFSNDDLTISDYNPYYNLCNATCYN